MANIARETAKEKMLRQQQQPYMGTKEIVVVVLTIGCIAAIWPTIIAPIYSASHMPAPINSFERSAPSRQERPAYHESPGIHPAMLERGRAIPPTAHIVPITSKQSETNVKHRVAGRPGPIPGLRPTMESRKQVGGATTSFLLPAYTLGIIVFFVYTLRRIALSKRADSEAADRTTQKSEFRRTVFEAPPQKKYHLNNNSVITAMQGLVDAADEHLLSNRSKYMATNTAANAEKTIPEKIIEEITNKTSAPVAASEKPAETLPSECVVIDDRIETIITKAVPSASPSVNGSPIKSTVGSAVEKADECSLKILGMDVFASSNDDHQQWTRKLSSTLNGCEVDAAENSIYLQDDIDFDANILVSEAETQPEEMYDDGSNDGTEKMIVLSSRMTLSLVNAGNDHRTN